VHKLPNEHGPVRLPEAVLLLLLVIAVVVMVVIVVPPPGGSGTCCNGDAGGDAEALAIVSYRTTAVGIYRSLPRLELVDISIFVWSESLLKAPLRPHKAALSPGNG
jgi:hypothetical protein